MNTNDNRVFSICMALSAGVMTYVSFVEIIFKAAESFADPDRLGIQERLFIRLHEN